MILKPEVKAEIKRKSIHTLITGTIAPLLILGISNTLLARILGIILYSVFLSLFALFEFSLRTGRNWNVPFASKSFQIMANEYELENKTMLGGSFICLSGLILISFFELHLALVGIMVLSYGDSAASIIGKAYPNHSISYNKVKHWEGTIAFVVAAFLATTFSLAFIPLPVSKFLEIPIIVAVVTALIESLPIKYYYDNLTIPLSATLLAYFLIAI